MKKITTVVVLVALVLGASSLAFAREAKAITKGNVDLTVVVSKWADISKLAPMTVKLTKPGEYEEVPQKITVSTNTNVEVEVSKPTLKDESQQYSSAGAPTALNWGLGFRHFSDSILRYPRTSFDIDAGEAVTKDLVFWAAWDNTDWWKLIAGNYQGTATITVSARD